MTSNMGFRIIFGFDIPKNLNLERLDDINLSIFKMFSFGIVSMN